jgi:hypothetical protein
VTLDFHRTESICLAAGECKNIRGLGTKSKTLCSGGSNQASQFSLKGENMNRKILIRQFPSAHDMNPK